MLAIMTGGTRGLGRVAAERIAPQSTRIMGARNAADVPAGWQGSTLDLDSLASVRAFVARLPDRPISHLVLNAGQQRADAAARSVDGFEATFATNHLAHYLLLRLLMPRLTDGARIVITSSGTHDPREKTGVPAPRHARAKWLAYPERDSQPDRRPTVAGMRAYSSSKLCNLLTARYLAQCDEARSRHWQVFAYDPGLTPGTGLIRNQPWVVRKLVWPLLPLVVPLIDSMNTLADAGRGLAELATTVTAKDGRVYAALRKGHLTWPDPSDIACDDAVMRLLWHDSEALVRLE
jgi:NAD(P)-dependent dehydrogenase (short-subunit alcohol dehydrogenase family)